MVNLWASDSDSNGFLVVGPKSLLAGGWAEEDVAIIDALREFAIEQYNVDTCRIYLSGYSAGAHLGYYLGLLDSEIYAGFGAFAGSMFLAVQEGVWPNQVTRKIAVDIRHGQADAIVPISEAQEAQAALESAGHPVELTVHGGGHEIAAGDPSAMWETLSAHSLEGP
jgi:predicted esterase